jgi:TM2 domain-containing membrane protein YozV
MANFFYYDQTNQKQGPVSEQQLKELAAQGVLGPHTPMETDTGHQGVAGQIPGLFPAAAPSPFARQTQAAPPPAANLYCTNCGNPVSEQAVACMSCGAQPVGHRKFCRMCGAGLNPEQVVCIKCGSAIGAGIKAASTSRSIAGSPITGGTSSPKSKIVAGLLALFLGSFGIHWFYLGVKNKALTYLGMGIGGIVLSLVFVGLILLVIVGILALIDAIKFFTMSDQDFDMQYNV